MIQVNFKGWTLDSLDDTFQLNQVWDSNLLKRWQALAQNIDVNDFDKQFLLKIQKPLIKGGKSWNEAELESKFITPIILQSEVDDGEIGYFIERPLKSVLQGSTADTIEDYEFFGIVDGIIATGFRNPKTPFFCMHEYKRSIENTGTPDAQALAAMMVAREMNENKKPIYGMYIVGLIWNFMVLEGNEYCISKEYTSGDEGVFEIFKMLKALKHIIKTELM